VLASRGVYISTGSACAERDTKPSPALAAIGLPNDSGMVRLSFGLETTADEIESASQTLADVIAGLS
jgi:cysteine desulfurase